jgi:hypothetical protein
MVFEHLERTVYVPILALLIYIAEINSLQIISRNDRSHPKKSCEIYLKTDPKPVLL